jgi:LmbE family N-acetylglucosaminyl deacetylase
LEKFFQRIAWQQVIVRKMGMTTTGDEASMTEKLRLLAILAHPDDESMGTGGILAKYAAEGVETFLVTATRGERGWFGDESTYPGAEKLAQIREDELKDATKVLGLKEFYLLDYMDGELDQANPEEVIAKLVSYIRKLRPHVVVTFDSIGYYGHPDHIAISQFTNAAVVAAASSNSSDLHPYPAHQVSKLYYLAANKAEQAAYQDAFGELVMTIDGTKRHATAWPDWAITTRIDTREYWRVVWDAIAKHCSQLPGYRSLLDLPEEVHQELWGLQTLYRAMSMVNGGREIEDDLFAGIRIVEETNV